MSKKSNNNQEDVKIETEYKDKNRKAKFNAKAHGKNGTKMLVIAIAIIAAAIVLIFVVWNTVSAVSNYLSNKKETKNRESINETTTASETTQEFTEFAESIVIETELLSSNDESFLQIIKNIEDDFRSLTPTKDSEEYSPEDGELLQKVSEKEKEYGEDISFEQLRLNIENREEVASRTPNARLYFLLGKDYQKLSSDNYSNDRDMSKVDCILKSNDYYIKSLMYYDLSFLYCDNEDMRVSKGIIFKYLSQNDRELGNIDKMGSYQHYCESLVAHNLYKENYQNEKGYVSSEIDSGNWYYTQGLIYFGIYESYPNDNREELQYIYNQCKKSYLNVKRSSQDYNQAQNDLNYFKSKYGHLYKKS